MGAEKMKRIPSRLAAVLLAVLVSLSCLCGLSATQAHASTGTLGSRILAEAQTRTGDWYVYGAAGPNSFDCSGLVYWSSHQLGIPMPRDTGSMLSVGVATGLLVRTWHPVAGDLAFYGTGHVEIVARGHDVTFGAQQTGIRIEMHHWNGWWHPTMYFEVR
jgi:cell wall-associated NlpC family hydrolase